MAYTTIQVSGLESYQPAVDYRRSGRIGVLSGRNFAWDASGVYSGYASRLISGLDSICLSPVIAQELDLETAVHVATNGDIWRLLESSPGSPVGTWELVTSLVELVEPDPADVPYDFIRWSTAYLGGNRYANSWNYGVFRVDLSAGPPPTYTRLTSGTVPGFPADVDPVISICETNGRLCFITETTFYFSAPNAPENLVPALGGAGFQVIGERIAGTPFLITSVSAGCIVWTSTGALVCEFIGGDAVFRYWTLATQALPVSAFAVTRMPDDDYVILTRLGLFMFNNLSQPQPITPLFNEFLREYLRSKPTQHGHVWYSITDNRLYVASRTEFTTFPITWALDIMLDRWGIFSEAHLGFFMYGISRGKIAYVNAAGVASFLLSPLDVRKNRESTLAPGVFVGLGSEIIIGWMRPENLINRADTVVEVQEIVINRLTPFGEVSISYFDEGFISDSIVTFYDEGDITDVVTLVYDEGSITEGEEIINYQLQVITDLFDFDLNRDGTNETNTFIPSLVRQNKQLDLWVTLAPTAYTRLRFIATESDEFYRANSLDLTVAYDGVQS